MTRILFALLLAFPLAAQTPQAAATPQRGSISGVVRAEGSDTPLEGADISASRPGSKQVSTTSDRDGRFTLKDLEAGPYSVTASWLPKSGSRRPTYQTRPATLRAGQDVAGFDIRLRLAGSISGKVVDENREPVAGVWVRLVVREYVAGALRYVMAGGSTTDDQGAYNIEYAAPDRPYLLLAAGRYSRLKPISDAPEDPKLRRKLPLPTYYPNSPTPDGAEPVTVKPGEHREGVDIRLRKAASFCIDAIATGPGGAGKLNFEIRPTQPTNGQSGSGGFYSASPGGEVGADGKLRICELTPGDYTLEVSHWLDESIDYLATVPVAISDRDISNIRVAAQSKVPLSGEVAWDGPAPEAPPTASVRINLQSLTRTLYPSATASLPGPFSFEGGVTLDEYSTRIGGLPNTLYVKDITYDGHSIRGKTLRHGTASTDASLRILIGQDGGRITATVTDKERNPLGGKNVLLLPSDADSEATLSARMQSGMTDQNGVWTSPTVAPSKYYLIALENPVIATPDSIAKLWRSRSRAAEVELSPGGQARVALEIKSLE